MDFARIVETSEGWRWRLLAFDGGHVLDEGGPHPTRKACVAEILARHPAVRVEQKPSG